jgi:hypothetical protein
MPFTVYTSAQFNYSEYLAYENGTSTTYSGGDYNADGYDYDIPNVPSFGRTIHTHRSSFAEAGLGPGLFQASQFPVPTFGTEGNLGRNTYEGPGYAQVNTSFERKFPLHFLGDAGALELRGEFLNLFNRVNYQNPISDMSNGDFGHSESQYMARQIQLQGHIRF